MHVRNPVDSRRDSFNERGEEATTFPDTSHQLAPTPALQSKRTVVVEDNFAIARSKARRCLNLAHRFPYDRHGPTCVEARARVVRIGAEKGGAGLARVTHPFRWKMPRFRGRFTPKVRRFVQFMWTLTGMEKDTCCLMSFKEGACPGAL